jgi:hypothetical protein
MILENKFPLSILTFGQKSNQCWPIQENFYNRTDTITYVCTSNYQPKLTLKVWSLFASIVQWFESVLFPKFWFPVKDVFSMLLGFKSSEREKNKKSFSQSERFSTY